MAYYRQSENRLFQHLYRREKRNTLSFVVDRNVLQRSNINDSILVHNAVYMMTNLWLVSKYSLQLSRAHPLSISQLPFTNMVLWSWTEIPLCHLCYKRLNYTTTKIKLTLKWMHFSNLLLRRNVFMYGLFGVYNVSFSTLWLLLPLTHWSEFSNFIRLAWMP